MDAHSPESRPARVLTLWEGEWADLRPMRFLPIPAGDFRMGSRGESAAEEPVHRVCISAPRDRNGRLLADVPAFWMQETPVTQAQLARWTSSPDYEEWLSRHREYLVRGEPHANWFTTERGGGPHHPAEQVSWHEASAFCGWLNDTQQLNPLLRAAGLPPELALRASLPSEAHWEYACRAGSETEYYTGDGEGALDEAAWYESNSGGRTHPVGLKRPSDLSLFDMHGNVWEWCLDAFHPAVYQTRRDGVHDPVLGEERNRVVGRVIRGGSWVNSARDCRSASRDLLHPSRGDMHLGFRVALFPSGLASIPCLYPRSPEAHATTSAALGSRMTQQPPCP